MLGSANPYVLQPEGLLRLRHNVKSVEEIIEDKLVDWERCGKNSDEWVPDLCKVSFRREPRVRVSVQPVARLGCEVRL